MTTLLSRRPWRKVSPVSMYWRRRRRMTTVAAAPLRIIERRALPVTRLFVHQHFHHASHSRLVFSPIYSTLSSTTTHVTPVHRNVTERILVKRMLEARPFDREHETPSPGSMMMRPAAQRPEPRRQTLVGTRAIDEQRRPAMIRSRLQRSRTVETQLLTTRRTHHETMRVTQSTPVRDMRWRQGMDVVGLEWRKATQPPAYAAVSPAVTGGSAPPRDQPRTSVEAAASTPASAIRADRPERTAPALTMDRTTLDRLADNVMQRIERHVRIERERRGL